MEEQEHKRQVEKVVLHVAQNDSSLRAVNLERLLKRKWTEEPNAYKIVSKIKTERQERRLAELMKTSVF